MLPLCTGDCSLAHSCASIISCWSACHIFAPMACCSLVTTAATAPTACAGGASVLGMSHGTVHMGTKPPGMRGTQCAVDAALRAAHALAKGITSGQLQTGHQS